VSSKVIISSSSRITVGIGPSLVENASLCAFFRIAPTQLHFLSCGQQYTPLQRQDLLVKPSNPRNITFRIELVDLLNCKSCQRALSVLEDAL